VGLAVTVVGASASLASAVGRANPVLPCFHGSDIEWQRGRWALFLVVQLVQLGRVWEEGGLGPGVTVVGASSSLVSAAVRANPVLPCFHGSGIEWQQG